MTDGIFLGIDPGPQTSGYVLAQYAEGRLVKILERAVECANDSVADIIARAAIGRKGTKRRPGEPGILCGINSHAMSALACVEAWVKLQTEAKISA
jgi:hypothetical protein